MEIQPPPLPRFQAILDCGGLDQTLVFNFLMVFSRAEFALKAAGCYRVPKRRQKKAEIGEPFDAYVSWCQVSEKVENTFFKDAPEEVELALKYLRENRPEIHKWLDDDRELRTLRLKWEARDPEPKETPLTTVLIDIRSIRNNMFHGGKELDVAPCERNQKLLSASLW